MNRVRIAWRRLLAIFVRPQYGPGTAGEYRELDPALIWPRPRRGITLFEVLLVVAASLVLFELAAYARRAHGAERSPVVQLSQPQGMWTAHASGTVIGRIDDRSIAVATCAHGWRLSDVVCVRIGGACRASRFEAHRYDQTADVAVVRVPMPGPQTPPCYPIGAPPLVGARLVRIGFPGDLPRHSAGGLTSQSGHWLWSTGPALQGESGGAVLAVDSAGLGTLVGVIKGTSRDSQIATSAEVVRDLAVGAWGRLPQCGAPEPDVAPPPPTELPIAPPPPTDPPLRPLPDPRFAELERRIAALEGRHAPAGPAGPQGPPGPQGPIGPAADLGGLRERVEKLEGVKIPVQILDEKGTIIDEESVPLGQPIRFRVLYRAKKSADAR